MSRFHLIKETLSHLKERDTSESSISLPLNLGAPFPKAFHRFEMKTETRPSSARKSIFAQNIAAKKAIERDRSAGVCSSFSNVVPSASDGQVPESESLLTNSKRGFPSEILNKTQLSRIANGLGLDRPSTEQEAVRIHEENIERLRNMSADEILEEQKKLFAQLDPNLISFLKMSGSAHKSQEKKKPSQKEKQVTFQEGQTISGLDVEPEMQVVMTDRASTASEKQLLHAEEIKEDIEETVQMSECHITVDELPVKPQKEWLHMDVVEYEKIEWMKDLPPPKKKKTRKGMQARFSFSGDLVPPASDLPVHLGLHHHGEEPAEAGYSLQELFHLSRSQFIQQRALSLQTLGNVVQKAKSGELASSLQGSVLKVLLDAGFLFLLRFSLDDAAENVIAAAVHTLKLLLVCPTDEEYLDRTFSWYQGAAAYPFLTNQVEEDDDDDEEEDKDKVESEEGKALKESEKPDADVAQTDLIKGLLKMNILKRLRYILEVARPVPLVTIDILHILIRIARHSSEACSQILHCPRLVESIVTEFLPSTWKPQINSEELLQSLHGIPCSLAMKLFRVMACGGRNTSAILLNKYDLKSKICRFVVQDPEDLHLTQQEAFLLSTEAFRLWAVAAEYGQACTLFNDLYPVLVKILHSLPNTEVQKLVCSTTWQLSQLRITALITLLANVTKTAGCAAALQAALTSDCGGKDHSPLPGVSWSHVVGLQTSMHACLKHFLKEIGSQASWEAVQNVVTVLFVYLGVYYNKLQEQPSYNPVECLQDLEQLDSEVLQPLLRDSAFSSMWEHLRSCSAVCNPNSCCPGPESVSSLVDLSCEGEKPNNSLLGSKSPFPFLTAVLYLINNIVTIHKGLIKKFTFVMNFKGLQEYLVHICQSTLHVTHASAWILRHEYHFQYLLLKLAVRMVNSNSYVAQQASLYHTVALTLLSRLLPGSEHLSHDLLSSIVFNQEFVPEGKIGGPEAEDLSSILHLDVIQSSAAPVSAAGIICKPSHGTLLREAYSLLPTIRVCYSIHFAYLHPAAVRSQASYEGLTHLVQAVLLPDWKGTILPADWMFLPLINLYDRVSKVEIKGKAVENLPHNLVDIVTNSLRWVLLVETWRSRVLQDLPVAARVARLMCVFLTGNDLFLEKPVYCFMVTLLSLYCQPKILNELDLEMPLPGLTSFYSLYVKLLEQFDSVSFGDHLFGCFILLPLQRRFNVQLRQAVFGEHVGVLRALGVPLKQFPVPLERYTLPPEDSLELLRLYFKVLVSGTLRLTFCPVLYVVTVAHVNSFIFSQDNVPQDMESARSSMLKKSYLLTDEVLKKHLLYYKLADVESPVGFQMYEELPPIRCKRLESVLGHALQK
ncbi:RNA polymerase II-associated protein 1 isoform X2 [Protopterus annectens]|uniref:RNA polymerase II-associated protein 1 isoform X2 n=1 Tax=Protopterus annectens TaxID=7888 RepID=UPI001CFA05CB|nr:RNA polymerase II-associated protein 1 isoform X2 [Protopterus annectens]